MRLSNRKPPYLVVHFAPHAPRVARWGGALWRCEVLDAITPEEEERRHGFARPAASHREYVRAAEIRLIEAASLALLFGAHGGRVVAVIDKAHALTAAEAERLAGARGADAVAARARVFDRWMAGREMPQNRLVDGHGSFLSIGIEDASPVGQALRLIEHEVTRRAQAALGDDSLLLITFGDPDESEEDVLLEPWASAAGALADAALALGAPEVVTADNREQLLAGWRGTFGAEPA